MEFTTARIRQRSQLIYSLPKLVEDPGRAAQENLAMGGRRNTAVGPIEQPYAKGALQIRDGL